MEKYFFAEWINRKAMGKWLGRNCHSPARGGNLQIKAIMVDDVARNRQI